MSPSQILRRSAALALCAARRLGRRRVGRDEADAGDDRAAEPVDGAPTPPATSTTTPG